MSKRSWLLVVPLVLVVAAGTVFFYSNASDEPATSGGDVTFRRLSEVQYKRSIEAIFGDWVEVPGRFDPPRREEGLLAIGNGRVDISRSGFEQAEMRAREIAAQVLAEDRREQVVACQLKSVESFDEQCASAFIEHYGKLLYRRPLEAAEQESILAIAGAGAEQAANFYSGLELGLSRMLLSPNYIYVSEVVELGATPGEVAELDQFSLASRISFLLWDAPPDAELLDFAERGELQEPAVLEEQVDRMISSPRFEHGVRAFFSDMFGYEEFEGLTKEQQIFPAFSSRLKEDAEEQVLRTIIELLVTNQGDYRDIFTTRKTFMNRRLSALYQVPAPEEAMSGWAPYEFSEEDERQGLLTLAAFLMLDPTHEGRTSPTIRGQAVREKYLCQKVPPPPPAVDFNLVQESGSAEFRTARDRLRVHAETPTCAGCHAITDPIGLALENYNAIGRYRATENGAVIDASGVFEGLEFTDALQFQNLLRNSDAVNSCLVRRVYEYGVGRPLESGEMEWMSYLKEYFANQGYALAPLMRRVATSRAFRAVTVPAENGQGLSVASVNR